MEVLLFISAACLFGVYRKRKFFVLSPVDFFIAYFVAVVFFTYVYHFNYPPRLKFNFYKLDIVPLRQFYQTMEVFLRMLVFFMIGVMLYSWYSRKYRELNLQRIKVIDITNLKLNFKLMERIGWGLLIVGSIMVFLDYGDEFFVRSQYIPKKSSLLKTVYQNLFIILSVISGLIYKSNRRLALFFITVTMIVGIALGSRTASIYLLLFGGFVSFFISTPRKRITFFSLFIPFFILFFGFNLSLRAESAEHGLVPYLEILVDKPLVIFKYVLSNIYYTLIFGFYDTLRTIEEYHIATVNNLITSLSPLPGMFTNWPQLGPRLRIYDPLPYTAIGEMAKFPKFAVFYYAMLGFYFALIDSIVKSSIVKKNYVFALIQFLLMVLYVIHGFEYNLRSTHRFVVYSALLLLPWLYLRRYKFVFKSKSNTQAHHG